MTCPYTLHRIADTLIHATKMVTVKMIRERVSVAKGDGLVRGSLVELGDEVGRLIAVQRTKRLDRSAKRPAPPKALRERINAKTMILAKYYFQECSYRRKPSGQYRLLVSVGEPQAWAKTGSGDQYSRKCKYHKTDVVHNLIVHPYWLVRVHKQGLAEIDDGEGHSVNQVLFVLDAQPIPSPGKGAEAFKLTVVEQSAGFSLRTGIRYAVRVSGGLNLVQACKSTSRLKSCYNKAVGKTAKYLCPTREFA